MTQQTNDQAAEVIPAIDDAAASAEALREKLTDAQTPGYQAEFDPDEADRAGAFAEDALSEGDALASTDDLADLAGDGSLEPAFLDDDGPSADLPRIVSTTNARKLYEPVSYTHLRPHATVLHIVFRLLLDKKNHIIHHIY